MDGADFRRTNNADTGFMTFYINFHDVAVKENLRYEFSIPSNGFLKP